MPGPGYAIANKLPEQLFPAADPGNGGFTGICFQPAGNTHPRFIGEQYFVCELTAFKEYTFPVYRRDVLQAIGMVYEQFAAIFFFPIRIEVHDHGILPAAIVPELIHVFFVETTFFIQCIMKFVPGNASITGRVQIADKMVHQVKKIILVEIIVLAVQPVNAIAPDGFILQHKCFITGSGRYQLLFCIKRYQVRFQMGGKVCIQKFFGNAYFVVNKAIDEGIKYILQSDGRWYPAKLPNRLVKVTVINGIARNPEMDCCKRNFFRSIFLHPGPIQVFYWGKYKALLFPFQPFVPF